MSNNVVDVLKGVVSELREIVQSETIVGEAITVGDKTVIPVIKVSVGFGAGGGQGEASDQGSGFGGGGGGGARVEPAAFIVMDEKGVKILSTGKGKWETLVDVIPDIASKVSSLAKKVKTAVDDKEHKSSGEHKGEDKE
jgi:uncharacterized spore protein YtfJ